MTTPTAVMTKLDAVNQMLASIGQSPLNTLTAPALPKDASKAIIALDSTLREVLTKGWSFNSDKKYPISPDVNGHILIPSTAMWVDPSDTNEDYVQRWENGEAKLYDVTDHTFVIDEAVECDIIWSFDFESIPQVARHYISTRAARIFQSQIVGSEILFQFTAQHEAEAEASLNRLEKRSKRFNFIGADNPIAYRHRNPHRY